MSTEWKGWGEEDLYVANRESENPKPTLRTTSVYAFKKENAELSTPVGELTQLPDALVEFFGLAEEARGEGEADEEVLDKVKALLRD